MNYNNSFHFSAVFTPASGLKARLSSMLSTLSRSTCKSCKYQGGISTMPWNCWLYFPHKPWFILSTNLIQFFLTFSKNWDALKMHVYALMYWLSSVLKYRIEWQLHQKFCSYNRIIKCESSSFSVVHCSLHCVLCSLFKILHKRILK